MKWKLIFNPFEKFDDKTLFIAGFVIFLITVGIGYFTGYKLDGIMHFDKLNSEKIVSEMALSFSVVIITILLIWGLGKIFNKRTRLIDITNTVLISMFPVFFMLILGEIPFFKKALLSTAKQAQENPTVPSPEMFIAILFAMLMLPLLIYNIILLYNGFKTATNSKKWQHIAIFFAVVFIFNFITQILI